MPAGMAGCADARYPGPVDPRGCTVPEVSAYKRCPAGVQLVSGVADSRAPCGYQFYDIARIPGGSDLWGVGSDPGTGSAMIGKY
jgi:hypothetical protein